MSALAASHVGPAVPPALARFTVDALLTGAARIRPDRRALEASGAHGSGATHTFGSLDMEVSRTAAALQECGLAPGETLYVAGGFAPSALILVYAGLRAGLHVALGLASSSAQRHAVQASLAGASAIAFAASDSMAARLFEAAAELPAVRFLGTHGGEVDGAVRLDSGGPRHAVPAPAPGQIITFEGDEPSAIVHDQRTLVAAALDTIAKAQIGAALPILSLLSPMRFAGLALGALASLLSGAPLHLHGPFDSASLTQMLKDHGPAHLVIPGAVAQGVVTAAQARPASLLLLWDGPRAEPLGIGRVEAVTDVYRLGERAIVPEHRGPDGYPVDLPAAPHHIPLDESEILAVEMRRTVSGGLEIRGAAVTGGENWRPL